MPDLAEEWSATPDGVTWTFRLRQGVTFHDGRRFTAADAIYSIEHILDPDTGSPQGEVLAAMIGPGSIEAFGDHFAGRPVLDVIDFSPIQDTTARVNALLAGRIDRISQTDLDFATAQVVSASSTATVARSANAQWHTIPVPATQSACLDEQRRAEQTRRPLRRRRRRRPPAKLARRAVRSDKGVAVATGRPPHGMTWMAASAASATGLAPPRQVLVP